MGEDYWLSDPRFKDDISRGDNGAVVCERMGRWCAERTTGDALHILGEAMIPAGPVLKPQQVLDDPHIQAMGFFQPIDYPGLPRPAPVTRVAVSLSETPGVIEHRPPMLGEHTDAILEDLGYDAAAIAAFREQGVI
jgi:crotonobetainyl-CoA:carnitine CoA-transferase CaiB-like acyl-CoA transferase